ncbi:DMT family transporter [Streptomyces sp. CB01881]|uniref:DMT family transporter n=1 Tax=Streptomyces sp. CB01881 TaxID=2078691 RepID=UPI001F11A67E|nr:DMT family transporter [Streptomyces sp. CB01881]
MAGDVEVRAGVVPVLAAAVLWGTVGPAQLLADAGVDPVALGACRMLLGGAVLCAVTLRPRGLRTLWRPEVRYWLLLSVAVTAVFQAAFLQAVERTGAAAATAAAFGTVPVVSGLCARALADERLDARWAAGTAVAVAGIGLLLLPGGGGTADAVGVALAVAAGAGFGVYIAASKRLGAAGGDPAAAAPVSVFGAGLLVSPWLAAAPAGLGSPRALGLIAWLALGTTALGYLLFTSGMGRISAATTGTLSLAEPLVAAVLGTLLLGERLGGWPGLGLVLLLGGLAVVALPVRHGGGAAAGSS